MKKIFEMETRILYLVGILVLGMQIPLYFLIEEGTTGLLLYGFLCLLIIVALVAGLVTGLFAGLVYIFIVGSVVFYLSMPTSSLAFKFMASPFPFPLFLGYGFGLILLILIAGRIHERIVDQGQMNRLLQDEIRQFVAVDVETGFDNKYRMATEIQAEMKRIERYGNTFTLLLLQLDFFEDFKQLYGEKETKHLLSSLAQSMQQTMRSTDRKFRYAPDRFALLLTNTDDHSVDIVFEKLGEGIKTHKLLKGKLVTLSFRSGHVLYVKGAPIQDYQTLFSKVESEMVTREL